MEDPGLALVVEDDDDVRHLVEDVLRQAGFEVMSASTGREGAEIARREDPAVVTLDLGLPDIDGFEVLRRIRSASDAYVVMLTGRDEESDTLLALQSGADDYLTKPFRPRELRARISAMLRRPRAGSGAEARDDGQVVGAVPASPRGGSGQPDDAAAGGYRGTATAPQSPVPPMLLRHSGLTLDPRARTAALVGTPLDLTRTEFDLLHALLRAGGAVITRAELVRVARGERARDDSYVSDADERAVEVHLGNLRRKLGDDPRSPRWLVTVRGVGYRLAPAS
ncbi:response regulator transcription factor [Sinomonas sp. JGH33]|uniref:Response regulator transcription factor n=1 Tax=Sinomonas terricola TaxID=3110330 RepID=A0ABU5T1A8_9MICC|nr:response regulator transcription factor [Sinomonas sp. JGH33]MEA5453442.1 response regulator transcription factor [Sinomonas sp. JGH33]